MAKAILKKSSEHGNLQSKSPRQFEYTPGKESLRRNDGDEIIVGNRLFLRGHQVATPDGTTAQTDSEIFVAREGKFLGTLAVADMLRPEATKAIQDLKSMGLKTVLLTGDSKAVADDIGGKLVSTISPLNSCPRTSWNSLAGSRESGITSSWWATESMMLPL